MISNKRIIWKSEKNTLTLTKIYFESSKKKLTKMSERKSQKIFHLSSKAVQNLEQVIAADKG